MKKALLLLTTTLFFISCKTQKISTSDTKVETTHSEVVIKDSVETTHVEHNVKTDSVVIETTIERETVITVDQEGNELKRETNTSTKTNRDHFRDTTKMVEEKKQVKHEESQENDSTLIQNHSEEKVIQQEPNLWDRICNSFANFFVWAIILAAIALLIYFYFKKWRGK